MHRTNHSPQPGTTLAALPVRVEPSQPMTVDRFNEAQFPPDEAARVQYLQDVAKGYSVAKQRRVVIAGLARDLAHILPATIARIERLGSLFQDYRVVVYENDSVDATRTILQDWAQRNCRVQPVCEDRTDPVNQPTRCLDRAARMAYYRSQCQSTIREHYADFDHVILVDMDLDGGWSYDGMAHTLAQTDWDFVGAYGIILRRERLTPNVILHYDAWAFRNDAQFTPLTTRQVNVMRYQRGQALQPVHSCFGGLGIYQMPVYLAGQYDGTDVEHVAFHKDLYQKGFRKIFLNPNLIVVYGRKHRTWDQRLKPVIRVWERIQGKPVTPWLYAETPTGEPTAETVSSSPASQDTSRAA